MNFRRLAALTLGAWLGGSVLVAAFTAQNTALVESLLARPAREAVDVLVRVQPSDLRMLLAYHATEGNQWLRGHWEIAQLALGFVTLLALFLGTSRSGYSIVYCVLMIATVVFLHFFLTPQIQRLAVSVDFVRAEMVSLERDRLRSLETGYTIAESVKLILGTLTAISLLRRSRRRSRHDAIAD